VQKSELDLVKIGPFGKHSSVESLKCKLLTQFWPHPTMRTPWQDCSNGADVVTLEQALKFTRDGLRCSFVQELSGLSPSNQTPAESKPRMRLLAALLEVAHILDLLGKAARLKCFWFQLYVVSFGLIHEAN
jgi:hypothetical protein